MCLLYTIFCPEHLMQTYIKTNISLAFSNRPTSENARKNPAKCNLKNGICGTVIQIAGIFSNAILEQYFHILFYPKETHLQ